MLRQIWREKPPALFSPILNRRNTVPKSLSHRDALSGIAAAPPVALPALAAGGADQDIELRRLWVLYCAQEATHIAAGEKMRAVRAAFDTEIGEDDDRGSHARHVRFWAAWGEDGDDEHSDNEDGEDEDEDEEDKDEDEDDNEDDDEDDDDEA
jgi:hypothetical protein